MVERYCQQERCFPQEYQENKESWVALRLSCVILGVVLDNHTPLTSNLDEMLDRMK